jgi:hypothetical protein
VTITAKTARKIRSGFGSARVFYDFWALTKGAYVSPNRSEFFEYMVDMANHLHRGITRRAFIRYMDTLLKNHEEDK